jgi:hypothetical protein
MSAQFEEDDVALDAAMVRRHVELHHAQAGNALQGAYKPGRLSNRRLWVGGRPLALIRKVHEASLDGGPQ